MRAFNQQTRQWLIWWLDSRNPTTLDPPVAGAFENGVGTFIGPDTLRGQPDLVPLSLVGDHRQLSPLGSSLLARQRRDLGSELDHALHPRTLNASGGALQRAAFCFRRHAALPPPRASP